MNLRRTSPLAPAILAFLFAAPALFSAEPGNAYARVDLVSDGGVPAALIDPDLINGWGLAASSSGPWWVNAADAGKSLLYRGDGSKVPLVVSVQGEPTGIVFNGGPNFAFGPPPGTSANFIFASEDGTISAWRGSLVPNTAALVVVDNSSSGAIYKGLAIDSTTGGTRIYAADFHNARIDVFDGTFSPLALPGAFVDSKLPEGYAPFNVQTLNGSVYVAFALQNEEGDEEVPGDGLGIIDQFDFDGQFISRVATGGALNAPWGMVIAPAGFGRFSGKLLVGNFGNGRINVFDPVTFEPKGHLKGTNGKAIQIDGLWGIAFGNGGTAGPVTTLYFAAGPEDEEHGLFGRLDAVPNRGLRTPVAAD